MQQAGVVGGPQEFDQVDDRGDIARQGVAKVRIEIRQAGAVDDQVERARPDARVSPGPCPGPAG